jgi:phage portal protein BeeE
VNPGRPPPRLARRPAHDASEARTRDSEALWSRVDKATFLTPDEKRAAVGYGPLDGDATNSLSPPVGQAER